MATEKENDLRPEPEPVESPSTELANVLSEGDPDLMLAVLEKKASLAVRFAQAINTILITQTYPEDWKQFGEGDKAIVCLSSAGAERVARHFGIKVFEVTNKKEEFTDSLGKGYRYVFEGKAAMGDRLIYAQGTYSTRDKFLGFKSDAFRAIEDINENDIRDAAYHIFNGNAIKALLGLRGIPAKRFAEIMGKVGEDANKSAKITHASGTQGGTSGDDQLKQAELGRLLMEIANACYGIAVDEQGVYTIEEMSEVSDQLEVAKSSCKALTSFYSKKDNKLVQGIDSAKLVKGQRLDIALKNAKTLWETFKKEQVK
jgi:hypothetical protein